MPVSPKTTWLFWGYLAYESNFQKIFEEEMWINIESNVLLCLLNLLEVILKSIEGPEDTCQGNLQA